MGASCRRGRGLQRRTPPLERLEITAHGLEPSLGGLSRAVRSTGLCLERPSSLVPPRVPRGLPRRSTMASWPGRTWGGPPPPPGPWAGRAGTRPESARGRGRRSRGRRVPRLGGRLRGRREGPDRSPPPAGCSGSAGRVRPRHSNRYLAGSGSPRAPEARTRAGTPPWPPAGRPARAGPGGGGPRRRSGRAAHGPGWCAARLSAQATGLGRGSRATRRASALRPLCARRAASAFRAWTNSRGGISRRSSAGVRVGFRHRGGASPGSGAVGRSTSRPGPLSPEGRLSPGAAGAVGEFLAVDPFEKRSVRLETTEGPLPPAEGVRERFRQVHREVSAKSMRATCSRVISIKSFVLSRGPVTLDRPARSRYRGASAGPGKKVCTESVGGPWISRWVRASPARDFAH